MSQMSFLAKKTKPARKTQKNDNLLKPKQC